VKPREMGAMWLRDRSRVLRQAAYGAEHAYSPESDLGRVCARVASAYRKAAVLLDDEATRIEDAEPEKEEPHAR
jgi:hypothetical protein